MCRVRQTDASGRDQIGEDGSAFDGDREIQKSCRSGRPEFVLDGFVDNLLHVRTTTTTSKTGTRCAGHVTGRGSALSDEAANLSIGDSAAMANEHQIDLSWGS
jgi:hypothetical protein